MTDLERFIELYNGIGARLVAENAKGEAGVVILKIQSKSSRNILGYNGFFTELMFDSSGKFISHGNWE
jgi:hypothetical protein